MRDGLPIGLGYFAVAFSLGIAARGYGFSAFQGFLASLLTYASAGQYIGFSLYALNASLLQLIVLTVITNLRYILMGAALNQRMPEGTSLGRRMLVGSCITDEIFGVTIARPGVPDPWFTFGALCTAVPMWAAGTAVGISMGSILPDNVVSALSVALFGMFLAVIVPPSRKDKAVGAAVIVSFACSLAAGKLPVISDLSQGNRTIILTVLISALFAVLFPRSEEAAEKEIMEEAEKISEDVEMYSRAEGGDADE
jgi:predicted branched-subunit amino acid permease